MGAVEESNARRMAMFMRNLENRMKEMELTLRHCQTMLAAMGTTAVLIKEDGSIEALHPVTLNPIDAPVENC